MRRLNRLLPAALVLIIAASPALSHEPTDLVVRLSKAYATYCDQLRKESRADELTMSGEEKTDSWVGGRWFGPRDSTWIEVKREIHVPETEWIAALPGAEARLVESHAPPDEFGYDCRDVVSAGFEIAHGESLFFTLGRAAEGCNETPLMIQKHGNNWGPKEPLPDLFDYNVVGLWLTGSYLIMNIKAGYEYGGCREGLAFWNLKEGWIHSLVVMTHVDYQGDAKEAAVLDPQEGLGVYLRNRSNAQVNESKSLFFLKDGSVKLAFWPAKQEWMLVP